MKSKIASAITPFLVGSLIITLSVLMSAMPKKDFSENENRYLATINTPSAEEIFDGSFFRSLTKYYSDHFPFREKLVTIKAISELLLFKGENNGIIFGKDGSLIPKGEYESVDIAIKNLNAISSFQESAGAILTIAPRSIDVLSSALPSSYAGEQNKIWDILSKQAPNHTSLLPLLRNAANEGEYVWYKTDHHWTTDGAYLAYTEISRKLEIDPYPKDFFKLETVSENFFGTSYSRIGFLPISPDTITLYRYINDESLTVTVEETNEALDLYDLEKLSAKDKYAVFLGGNYARLCITNENQSNPRMLLIKDSYANSVIPFLALHYNLDVIDPRYYKGNLTKASEDADITLILLGIDTVATTPLTFSLR